MKVTNRPFTLLVVVVLILCSSQVFAQPLRFGIVMDGSNQSLEDLIAEIDSEVKSLVAEHEQITFSPSQIKNGAWNTAKINQAIDELMTDSSVDAVLALGAVSSHLLATRKELPKPAFAAHVINSKMQELEYSENSSGKKNLNYIDLEIDMGHHIDRFLEVYAFQQLHLVISPYMLEGIPQLESFLKNSANKRNIELVTVKASQNVVETARALDNAQAIYFSTLINLPSTAYRNLVTRINENKIPTMSMIGRKRVEEGIFIGISMDIDTKKLARRLALNIQRLTMGDDPAHFTVSFTHPERLTFNMETARQIGIFPTWAQMTDAVLINQEPTHERLLTISEVIQTALVRSLQLAAKRQELEAGTQNIERARSNLRPKLSIFGRQGMMDTDRAQSLMSPAKHTTQIGADLLYVLHSEQAKANIDIRKIMQAARQEEERALVLDIINDAAIAYLNVLKTKTMQTIQSDNLELTRANLEIAKFREQVGRSGPAEVYRWEIQMAGAKQAVIEASAMRKKSELALNQILNASQEEEFTTAECDIFSQAFFLDYLQVAPYIDNQKSFKVFRDFLVADTFAFSPEIQQVGMAIKAQERLQLSSRRKFREPEVALQGNVSRTVRESGAGANPATVPPPFSAMLSQPDKVDWYVGVNMSLNLHDGGDRTAALREVSAEIEKLRYDREFLMQRLELNTRASLEDARSSFSSISLAQSRADYAEKALDLVQSAYSRGAVNILDLIDSQNAALVAREASTNSIFNFLSDFVKVCRAVGTFDFIISHEYNMHWYERLNSFFKHQGDELITERRRREQRMPDFQISPRKEILYQEDNQN